MMGTLDTARGSEPARRAYRYIAETMPPDADLDVLNEYEDAAIRAQRAGDFQGYQEALREMCKTAKKEVLEGSRSEEGRGVILTFALLTVLCAMVVAALFLTMWLEEDTLGTAVLGVVLMPLLVLAILAVRVAL
jgi:Flp pilus assembly protein TadB